MNTPIFDFVKEYASRNFLRLHMPGHKGKSFIGCESFDITEISGADVLYCANGIIKESQDNAASLFGTAKTLYSAEGSSLSIRAMLFLVSLYAKEKCRRPLILAARNVHKAFVSGAALLDIDVEWIYSENSSGLLSCNITPSALEAKLSTMEEKPIALYVTSPDYTGNVADIESLSKVCKTHDILLITDNAHGAYLQFLPQSQHPIAIGADMCCDSAHKTLPVLTGGGYLHISKSAPQFLARHAEQAMTLFASTSPSYLILQSLDIANKYLCKGYPESLLAFCEKVIILKKKLRLKGYRLVGNEPLKITIFAKPYGYKGLELSEALEKKNIVCEFSDPDFAVMMLTPQHTESDLEYLEKALLSIEEKESIFAPAPTIEKAHKALSIREAMFSASEEIPASKSAGRILASAAVNCPPAIPVVVSGEVISEQAVKAFEYYGISTCKVIK